MRACLVLAAAALAACRTTPASTSTASAAPQASASEVPRVIEAEAPPAPSASAIGVTETAAPAPGQCAHDDDCVVSTFEGCCASCGTTPYGTLKTALAARHRSCGLVHCAFRDQPCPPRDDPSHYRAVCRAGACQAIKR